MGREPDSESSDSNGAAGWPRVATQGLSPLILRRTGAAQAFDGGAALHRRGGGLTNELAQPLACVGAIALLGAMPLRGDDKHALARETLAREPLEPHAHVMRQRGRMAHVETQLHGARELVDVLPARP